MALSDAASLIPVTLLTGFPGSGKTTVLNHVLKQPDMTATAVIVNEFGEIGLDHLLVERSNEDVVLLNSGCLCCTVRGDIVDTLTNLFVDRVKGKIPYFTRVAIETTGLADPAPILHTLMTHGVQHLFHPPVLLPAWPSEDRRTRMVFITRDLPRDAIEATL